VRLITLYARVGCHLCDDAREGLRGLRREVGGLELREVDIDSDDDLLSRYLERIPVIELDGEIVSELELDADELRAKLSRGQA
jgi:glutaredoxin